MSFFHKESSFWQTAMNWTDSVSPKILGRVLAFVAFSTFTTYLCDKFPSLSWSVGPLEISGAVLGLILVVRTNAGYDRWWEARKLWGGIVNQSRNIAIMGSQYGPQSKDWQIQFQSLTKQFPRHAMRVLRSETVENEAVKTSFRISQMVMKAHRNGYLSGFEFQMLEQQRSQLIDHLGGCERILNTPLPRVLDINVRRFILIYLTLAPFGLVHKMGWYTPLIIFFLSYSLLALDQIGLELQNPFSKLKLSSLPLEDICDGIQKVINQSCTNENRFIKDRSQPHKVLSFENDKI